MQPDDRSSPSIRRLGEGPVISVVGDLYRFLATGAETGGRYATWDALIPPGGGPPPHIHSREEETFYVLEGDVTFQLGEDKLVAGPGTFVRVPIGALHTFHNASDRPARMIISVAPAGIEEMFFAVGQPATVESGPLPPTPEEIERLLALAPKYGIEIRVPHA